MVLLARRLFVQRNVGGGRKPNPKVRLGLKEAGLAVKCCTNLVGECMAHV